MTDFAAIETAYKNADWAEVLCLLDEHFGNTPTPQYSTLKINIEGYLIQALMPPNAAIQGLRLLINQLKKNDETTTPDEKHQAQQRGNDMSAQKYKDFYHYLLKFPYHSHHETIHNYFCSCQLKINALLIHGVSKEISDVVPKFSLIVHFLFDKIKKDDDDKPPHVFGVTSAANCENGDKIIYEFLNQLEVDKIPNTPLGMRQQFVRNVTKLLEAQSVIIPYIIKYDNIDKDCTHFKTFLEDYWNPISQSINDNLSEISKYTLVLLLIIDDEREGKHTLFNFSLLNDEICEDNFPSNVAVELAPVEKQICSPWVNKAGEFFKKNTFCESFNGKWKNNTFSFPDCGTMEGLFEKISKDIFPDLNFSQFLKSNHPHHKISK